MLKDVTLGQYFPGTTAIHRLDPRTKLVLVIVYIVALFLAMLVRTIFKIIKTDRMCNATSINTKEEVSHLNNVKYNPTSPSAIITNGIILPNHIFNFIQSTHFCIE